MIAYLQGTIIAKSDKACVVLTSGGVGYEVFLASPVLAALPKKGEEVKFYIHTIVREDALELYGFTSWDERRTFETLLSITKLGPKISLAILSRFQPDDLRRIVLSDDYAPLIQVPGIGAKRAQRIFLELKYKIETQGMDLGMPPDLGDKAASRFRDALAGLVNLGYEETEVRGVLEEVFTAEPDLDVAEALRMALKTMAKRRA